MAKNFNQNLQISGVAELIQEKDEASLIVLRSRFVNPNTAKPFTVTTVNAFATNLIPKDLATFPEVDEDDDSVGSAQNIAWLAQQTGMNGDSLFSAVSYAMTGKDVKCTIIYK